MADSEDEDGSLNLTGFLFGNINEKGELEDTEILDEVIYTSDESIVDIFLFNLLDGLKTFAQQIENHKDTFQHDLFWSLFLFFFFFDKRYILSVIWENSFIALENWFFFSLSQHLSFFWKDWRFTCIQGYYQQLISRWKGDLTANVLLYDEGSERFNVACSLGDFDRNRKKKNELYFISLSGQWGTCSWQMQCTRFASEPVWP